jgi:RNA polymerase sigma factor (sigma-70 family)
MDANEFRDQVLPVSGRLFRYAKRMLGNTHDAEDVIQDIWVKLWDRKDSLAEVRNIEAFAFRITRNLCLDRLKLKRPQYYDDRENHAFRFDEADGAPDPGKNLELKDTMDRISSIITGLPEQQQTLLQLRDIEGLEYEQIAGVTGMEVNAIRVNLSRARKKIRESLQKINEA